MARFAKGDIVVVPFPFFGSPDFKLRPVVIFTSWPFGNSTDYLVGIITSQKAPDLRMIELEAADVEGGALTLKSYIRPAYLFSVSESVIKRKIGRLKEEKLQRAIASVCSLLNGI